MQNQHLRKTPQEELEQALAGYQAYAVGMYQNRPTDVQHSGGVIPIFSQVFVQKDDSLQFSDHLTVHLGKIDIKRMPRKMADIAKAVQAKFVPTNKAPDMRVRRTPGQPAEGIQFPFIAPDQSYQVTEVFNEADDPFTKLFVQNFMLLANERGYLLPKLLQIESAWHGRWRYWDETQKRGKLLNAPIPQVAFLSEPHPKVIEHLHHCLDTISPAWRQNKREAKQILRYFLDWCCWSFGHPLVTEFPRDRWGDRTHDKLFQVFNLEWLLAFPYDYFGYLLETIGGQSFDIAPQIEMTAAEQLVAELFPHGWQRKAAKRGFGGAASFDYRNQLLFEQQSGSGRLGLVASNHCLITLGYETNRLLATANILNGYLYQPWLIYPFLFQFKRLNQADMQNLLGRYLLIVNRKGLQRDWLSQTRPATDRAPYYPVQLRQWRRVAVEQPEMQAPTIVQPELEVKLEAPTLDHLPQLGTTKTHRALPGQKEV